MRAFEISTVARLFEDILVIIFTRFFNIIRRIFMKLKLLFFLCISSIFPLQTHGAIDCTEESTGRNISLEFNYNLKFTEIILHESYSSLDNGVLLGKLQFSSNNGELRVKLNEFIGGESTILRTDIDGKIYKTHNYFYLDMEISDEGEIFVEDSKFGTVFDFHLINCRANSSH